MVVNFFLSSCVRQLTQLADNDVDDDDEEGVNPIRITYLSISVLQKNWLFSIMSLEKGSTLSTPSSYLVILEGFRHPNFMNPFGYGKSSHNKSLDKPK